MTGESGDDAAAGEDPAELLARSDAARTRGDYHQGRRLAERVVATATATGDDASLGRALRLVCNQALRLGDLEDAARAGHAAVLVCERLGDRAGQVDALNLLTLAHLELGLFEEALGSVERSVERSLTLDDAELRSGTFNRAGTVRSAMGDFEGAASLFERAAAELAGGGASDETTFCLLTNTADLVVQEAHSGRVVEPERLRHGLDLSRRALALARAAQNPYRQAISLLNGGTLSAYLDDAGAADATLGAAMDLSRRHGYRSLELGVLETLAVDAHRRGEHAEAVERFGAVAELAAEVHDAGVLTRAHHGAAQCLEELGRFREALAAHRSFHDLEAAQRSQTAQVRARLLGQALELQRLRHEAASSRRQAHEDPLTGLANRRSFDLALPELLAGPDEGDLVCLALLDVDHFKAVNDAFGHPVGDEVLRRLGSLMREEVRRGDLLARIGGEEFALVRRLGAGHPAEDVGPRLERLRRAVEDGPWGEVAAGLRVTISVGAVLVAPGDARTTGELVRRADRLLYAAKAAGRNRVLVGPLSER